MTTLTSAKATLLSDLRPGDAALPTGPDWFAPARDKALAAFESQGLPTLRHEEWRFTNIKPIRETAFRRPDDQPPTVDAATVRSAGFDLDAAATLVFINGRYSAEHSHTDNLPAGVTVAPLSEALDAHRALIEPHLAHYADVDADAFIALNTACIADGAFVHIPDNATVEKPIVLLNVSAAADEPFVIHPRTLIVAGENSEATIIEDYVGLDDDTVYFNNVVTEASVSRHARIAHYMIERESDQAFNISTLRVNQADESDFGSHTVLLGGRLVRNNVHPVLDGEHCESLLNGLFLPEHGRHTDNHMRVVHAKPNCNSRQYYRGIMGEKGHGVFTGRIVVVEDAQKTDAIQSNNNLLLTPTSQVNTKPQLEIYADDVRCTHGATIGQLDEDAIFYLKSRGLTDGEARSMLVASFAGEILDRMEHEPLREQLRTIVLDRLANMTETP